MDIQPLVLSFQLALLTTLCLLLIGVPLAYTLAKSTSKFKAVLEAIISMPLVLPPTVIGFYLLLFLSPQSGIGQFLSNTLGLQLIFSFPGLVLASIIYSFPFMIQPLQSGFEKIPQSLVDAARVLGKNRPQILWRVLLPNMKPTLISAIVLTFAHTLGEFGVVLMIGGNIPGETKVASIAIYNEVEQLNYSAAHGYSLVLMAISFLVLYFVYRRKK